MSINLRLFLRFAGIVLIGVALFGSLPGYLPVLLGIIGVIGFLAAGPT